MTDEADLHGWVGTLGMPEVAEKTEKLLCARTGCAAQMAPCASSNMSFVKAAKQYCI